jgi:hypothetical protein
LELLKVHAPAFPAEPLGVSQEHGRTA